MKVGPNLWWFSYEKIRS